MKAIDAALLDTIAACGDVNRNVMCNPNPYQSRGHAAALELARAISDHLTPRTGAYHEIWLDGEKIAGGEEDEVEPIYGKTYLPRKFKIVVAVPPSNDVDVFAHDLGFIAILDERATRRLERHRRRRHGHDPRRAGHLSAHRRCARLLPAARRGRDRRSGRHRAARLGRPHQPQARAAQIHDRGSRARCLPRRGRDAAPARRSQPARPFTFTSTGDRYGWTEGDERQVRTSRCSSRTAACRTLPDGAACCTALREIAEDP